MEPCSALIHFINAERIPTFWSSKEVLGEMRKTLQTPHSVLIFREAKGEPALSIFNVAEQIPLE